MGEVDCVVYRLAEERNVPCQCLSLKVVRSVVELTTLHNSFHPAPAKCCAVQISVYVLEVRHLDCLWRHSSRFNSVTEYLQEQDDSEFLHPISEMSVCQCKVNILRIIVMNIYNV